MSESHYSAGDYFKSNYSDEVLFTAGSQSYITLGVCSTIVIGLNTDFRFGYDFQCGLAEKLELIAEEEFKNIPVAGRAFKWSDQVYLKSLEWVCGLRNRRADSLKEISLDAYNIIGGWSFFKKAQLAASVTIPPINNWTDFNLDSFLQSDANTIYGLPLNLQTKFLPWVGVNEGDGSVHVLTPIWRIPVFWGKVEEAHANDDAKTPWNYVGTVTSAIASATISLAAAIPSAIVAAPRAIVSLATSLTSFSAKIPSTIWYFISGKSFQDLKQSEEEVTVNSNANPLVKWFIANFASVTIAPKCQSFYGEIHHQCFSIYSVSAAQISLKPSEALFIQTNGDDFEVSANFHNFM